MKKSVLFLMMMLFSVSSNILSAKTYENLPEDSVVVIHIGDWKIEFLESDYKDLSDYLDEIFDNLEVEMDDLYDISELMRDLDVSIDKRVYDNKKHRDTVFCKDIEKSFDVSENSRFIFNGGYSTLNIKTWNKDKIEMNVKVVVLSDSNKKNNYEFTDIFEVDASNKNGDVYLDVKKKFQKKNNYTVVCICEVTMPEYIGLDINSIYSDVTLENVYKPSSFDISYGSLKGFNAYEKIDLQLRYGDCEFDNINDLDANIYYSDCEFDNCKSFTGEVYYSDIKLGNTDSVDIKLSYGDLVTNDVEIMTLDMTYSDAVMNDVGKLDLHASYSDVTMNNVNNSCDAALFYSDMYVKKVTKSCSRFNVEGSYSELKTFNEKDGKNVKMDKMSFYISL